MKKILLIGIVILFFLTPKTAFAQIDPFLCRTISNPSTDCNPQQWGNVHACSQGGNNLCCPKSGGLNDLCPLGFNEVPNTPPQQQQQQQQPAQQQQGGAGQNVQIGNCGVNFIDTAIGCIPINDRNALIGFFLGWAVGIAGGVAFLFIVYAGFLIITSSGDPKRLQAGRELITAAISGVILLIFSVFILRLVGIDILGIRGLGT